MQIVTAPPQQCGANSPTLREMMDVQHLDCAGIWYVCRVSLNLAGFLPDPAQTVIDKLAADLDENLVGIVQPVFTDGFANLEATIEVISGGFTEPPACVVSRDHGNVMPESEV